MKILNTTRVRLENDIRNMKGRFRKKIPPSNKKRSVISSLNNYAWVGRRHRRQVCPIRFHMKRNTRINEPLG
jgi:hypothetical protein